MALFDRQITLNNIYFLAKEKGIRMGDLENKVGVSTGYFSRQIKEGSTANPGVEVLAAAAEIMGVSLDALISHDYAVLSASERYVMDFLDRLTQRTSTLDIIWGRELMDSLRNPDRDNNGDPVHPLFEAQCIGGVWRIEYASRFCPCADIAGDGFCVEIAEGTDLHLNWVRDVLDEVPFEDQECGYELHLTKRGVARPVCSFREPNFGKALLRLAQAASESAQHVRVSDDVRSVIDTFMHETTPVQLLDDEDGELPF